MFGIWYQKWRIHSKDVDIRAIDAITLLEKVGEAPNLWKKDKLRNDLSEDYKTICEKDNSEPKQLVGDDLADNLKKSKGYTFCEPVHFK